ncbi:spermine synthase [candidate division WOR-3 bacterium]|uniref:Polyamine aminopropyltransferase n=1 Tax=candidate division WOR-3 bacterium TaxID=2052148 RepID=A0A660SLE7_UNCW3|nr:MAG: spermine synthase [candidate division WOR-3 bacterium]
MIDFVILVLGASGIVGQIVLLREFIITFSGNELSIGVILANWVVLEAIGSFLIGRMIDRSRFRLAIFLILTLIFSVGLPTMVYLVRIIKSLIQPVPGVGLGLSSIVYLSLLLLLPVSLIHGGLFTVVCRLYADRKGVVGPAGGRVYFLETGGTIIGGIILSFLLIPLLSSFRIALIIAIINLLTLSLYIGRGRIPLLAATAVSLLFYISPLATKIEAISIRKRFFNQKVVFYRDSYYGNVAVTRRAEQQAFYVNGVPIFTSPYPDITFVEEFVHLPLLFKDRIEDVLIISGGTGGIISELLKYHPRKIDYVELDPLLITAVRDLADSLTERELSDPKVKIHNLDGRLFLLRTRDSYDLILIGLSAPTDLQINRLFTDEFYRLARYRLRPDGIIVLYLPGSLTYLSRELKMINRSIINTLRSVFDHLFVIPGDYNLIVASPQLNLSSEPLDPLIKRFYERPIPTRLLTEGHIRYRFGSIWQDWFWSELEGVRAQKNLDLHPMAMLYTLEYWSAARARWVENLLKRIESVGPLLIPITLVVVGIIILLNLLFGCINQRRGIILAIFTTGMAGMVFQLILIMGFQILYGYVYFMVSLLITAMMAGMAIGSWWATRLVERGRVRRRVLFFIDLAVLSYPLLLIGVILILKGCGSGLLSQISFLLLAIAAGGLIGLQFPIGNSLLLQDQSQIGATVGSLYGADLLGGWLGGIGGSLILFPIGGLISTLLIVAAIKAITVLTLLR